MAPDQAPPPDDDPDGGAAPPTRKPFLLRLPPELLAELRAWANHDLRSLNGHLEFLLREAVRRRNGGSAPREQESSHDVPPSGMKR